MRAFLATTSFPLGASRLDLVCFVVQYTAKAVDATQAATNVGAERSSGLVLRTDREHFQLDNV